VHAAFGEDVHPGVSARFVGGRGGIDVEAGSGVCEKGGGEWVRWWSRRWNGFYGWWWGDRCGEGSAREETDALRYGGLVETTVDGVHLSVGGKCLAKGE
jgi:hypothetical protein